MKPRLKKHPNKLKKFLPVFMPGYFNVKVRTSDGYYCARIDKINYTANTAYIECTI